MLLDDVPDGEWIIIIRRDIFNKVAGSVRNYDALKEDAVAKMVQIAVEAAEAGRSKEASQLGLAATLSLQTPREVITEYLNATMASFTASLAQLNASGAFEDNGLYSEDMYLDWREENYPFMDPRSENGTLKEFTLETLLPGEYDFGNAAHFEWYKAVNECSNIPEIHDPDSILTSKANTSSCQWYGNMTAAAFDRRLGLVRSAVSTRMFLSELEVKYSQGNLSEALGASQPELLSEIGKQNGIDPERFPTTSDLKTLALFYLEPVKRGQVPPAFKAPLSKTRMRQLNWEGTAAQEESFAEVRRRIDDRLAELEDVSQMMEDLAEVKAMRQYAASKTISDATYNFISWVGGPDAYMTTNLTQRGPQYIGDCR